jgi:uncharacterized protein YndB with AHSA1/START domain
MNNPNTAVCTSRILSVTPRQIFAAFEQPALLARWWGPSGFTSTFDLFEFRTDGRWAFVMHGPNSANYPNKCVFREVQPDARIVIEHIVNPWFKLTVTLSPEDDQTRLD